MTVREIARVVLGVIFLILGVMAFAILTRFLRYCVKVARQADSLKSATEIIKRDSKKLWIHMRGHFV